MKDNPVPVVTSIIAVLLVSIAIPGFLRSEVGGDQSIVRATGAVAVREVKVSFPLPGRVTELVGPGYQVVKGDILALLDDERIAQELSVRRAELRLAEAAIAELKEQIGPEEIKLAEADYRQAKARLAALLATPNKGEIAIAEAVLARARAEEKKLRRDCERLEQLRKDGLIPAEDYESAVASCEMATAKAKEAKARLELTEKDFGRDSIKRAQVAVRSAEARLERAKRHLRLREGRVQTALARLELLKESLRLAEMRFASTRLESPLSGVILSKHVETGEHTRAGTPIVTVGEMGRPYVQAYIEEADIHRIKISRAARVIIASWPNEALEGRVPWIATKAERPRKHLGPGKSDLGSVFAVRVSIPSTSLPIRPGMSAVAEIVVQPSDN